MFRLHYNDNDSFNCYCPRNSIESKQKSIKISFQKGNNFFCPLHLKSQQLNYRIYYYNFIAAKHTFWISVEGVRPSSKAERCCVYFY